MKTYLLPRTKATVFALLLPLMNATLSAQTITKHYANNESNSATSTCLPSILFPGEEPEPNKCAEVINPLNAIGNNENDYSVLKINYAKTFLGRVSQILIFRNVNVDNNTNKIIIGIGTGNGTSLSADILKDLSLTTGAPLSYYGIYSNDIGYKQANNITVKLGGPDPTRGEIEIPCTSTNPCDRIRIEKDGLFTSPIDLLNGYERLNELRIYYAYQYQNTQSLTNNILVYNKDGMFTLDKNIETEGSEVTLTNTSGKEVFHSRLNSNTFEAKLPEGMYILKLQTKENKTYTSKVIVK